MAQNITVAGASYSAVPAVQLPKTGGGTATFVDETETPFVVTLSYNSTSQKWEPDKTLSQIQAAYASGKDIVVGTSYSFGEVQADGNYDSSSSSFLYSVTETINNGNGVMLTLYVYSSFGIEIESQMPTYYTGSANISSNGQLLNGICAVGYDGTEYYGTIQTKTSANLSASGATVTAEAGYYASSASKAVASGTVTAPASITGSSATVSTGTNTLTLSKTVSVTPSVTTAGYVSSGTAGNSSVSLTASVTTQAAQTIHPSTSDQSITSGKYLTGNQTIKGVLLTNLLAENIKSGVTVKVGDSTDDDCVASVLGTYTGGGITAATGEITLASDFSLTTSAQNIPGLQLSFQPDFFYIVMKRASFISANRSNGLYGLIAVKRSWYPPVAASTSSTAETTTSDYTFMTYQNVYNNTSISTSYGLGMPSMLGGSYYSRFAVNANGTISVGRYSTASTKMYAGTYRYFAFKI